MENQGFNRTTISNIKKKKKLRLNLLKIILQLYNLQGISKVYYLAKLFSMVLTPHPEVSVHSIKWPMPNSCCQQSAYILITSPP
jgi:hypothetical protein